MVAAVRQFQLFPNAYSGSFTLPVLVNSTLFIGAFSFLSSNATITANTPDYNGAAAAGASQIMTEQSPFSGGGTVFCNQWMVPNVAASGSSISLLCNGATSTVVGLVGMEVTGLGSTPSVDAITPNPVENSGTTGIPAAGPTGGISAGGGIVIGMGVAFGSAITSPSGWNAQQFASNFTSMGYMLPTSAGGTFTFTTSSTGAAFAAGVVAVKSSAGGGPPSSNNAGLLMACYP